MSKDDKKSQTKQQKKLLKRIAKLEDRVEAIEDELDEIVNAYDDETDALVEAMGRVIAAGGSAQTYQAALDARFGAGAQTRDYVGELNDLLEEYDPDADDDTLDDIEARISCLEHDRRVDELEEALLEAAAESLAPAEAPEQAPQAQEAEPADAQGDEDVPVRVRVVEIEED